MFDFHNEDWCGWAFAKSDGQTYLVAKNESFRSNRFMVIVKSVQ